MNVEMVLTTAPEVLRVAAKVAAAKSNGPSLCGQALGHHRLAEKML